MGPGLHDIEKCFQEGEDAFQNLDSAYHQFAKKDLSGVKDGLSNIAVAIQDIVAGLDPCKSSVSDIETEIA